MSYDEDLSPHRTPRSVMTNEDVLRYMIFIVTILMIIIGLPSLFSNIYENPLPGIVMLGFLAVILSIFYLATQVNEPY